MDLTLKQKKILELLSLNCRYSNKDIGKAVRLSEDAVAYHIEQLISQKKLGKFNTQVDYHRIGYTSYHVFIRLADPQQSLEALSQHPDIISVNTSLGIYDVQVVFLARTHKARDEILKHIKKSMRTTALTVCTLTDNLKPFSDVIVPLDTKINPLENRKNFVYRLSARNYLAHAGGMERLDGVDKAIIRVLIEDPRTSYQDIALRAKMNHETVRYRLRRLIARGVITHFGILHDFSKYGLTTTYVLLKCDVSRKELSKTLQSLPAVFYSAALCGDYDAIIYFAVPDVESLHLEVGKVRASLRNTAIERFDALYLGKVYKYVQFPGSAYT